VLLFYKLNAYFDDNEYNSINHLQSKIMHKIIILSFFIAMIHSIAGCSSSQNDVVKDGMEQKHIPPPPLAESVSPGTAQVEALLVKYIEKDDYYYCRIRIKKVLAYGPATPPLAEGSELSTEIAKDLLIGHSESLDKMVHSDSTFAMTIRMKRIGFGMEANEEQIWRVIKID
jgi:hypothetical protein